MKNYYKIRNYFSYLWYITIPLAITGILYDSLMSFVPVLEGRAINSIKEDDLNNVFVTVMIYLSLVIFIQINRLLKRYLVRMFANKMNYMMKGKAFEHMLNMDMSYFDSHDIGDTLNKTTSDISSTCESVRKMTTEIFDTVILMIGYIFTYTILDYKVALMNLPFIFGSMTLSLLLKKKIYTTTKESKEYTSYFKERTLNLLKNEFYLKGMGISDRYKNQYDNEIQTLAKKNTKSLVYKGSMESIYASVAYLGLFFIIFYGIRNVMSGSYEDIGTFSSILTTYLLIARKAAKVGKTFNAFQGYKVTYKRIKPFLEYEVEHDIIRPNPNSGLVLKNFSMGYEGFKLPTINYEFNNDEIIGIVGRVHSGKSTFLKALTGIYGYDGEAYLDDVPLNQLQYTKEQYVSFCPNKDMLFKDTIKNNIELDRDGNFDNAISVSQVDKDFESYDRILNPSLANVSGGQKQRVMLARSLYSNSKMILLDNPFSSLETKMAHEIFSDIKKINSLRIIATNDSYMLEQMDRIIFFDKDKVLIDTYQNLMKNDDFKALMGCGI